jgi:hypothetical protein
MASPNTLKLRGDGDRTILMVKQSGERCEACGRKFREGLTGLTRFCSKRCRLMRHNKKHG